MYESFKRIETTALAFELVKVHDQLPLELLRKYFQMDKGRTENAVSTSAMNEIPEQDVEIACLEDESDSPVEILPSTSQSSFKRSKSGLADLGYKGIKQIL